MPGTDEVVAGFVGIGTETPTQSLEVHDGNIKISGTPGYEGIIFPDGSKQTSATPGAGAWTVSGSSISSTTAAPPRTAARWRWRRACRPAG